MNPGNDNTEKLKSHEDRFNYDIIFDVFPDIVVLISQEGIILHCKAGAGNPLLSSIPGSFTNKKFTDCIPEEISTLFQEAVQKAIESHEVVSLVFKTAKEGTEYWQEARLKKDKADSNNIAIVIRDITTRKKAELLQDELLSIIKNNFGAGLPLVAQPNPVNEAVKSLQLARANISSAAETDIHTQAQQKTTQEPDVQWWQLNKEVKASLKNAIEQAANDVHINFETETTVPENKPISAHAHSSLSPIKEKHGTTTYQFTEAEEVTFKKEDKEPIFLFPGNTDFFNAFAESIPDGGMLLINRAHEISFAGGNTHKIFRTVSQQITGKKLSEIIPVTELLHKITTCLNEALKGERRQMEWQGNNWGQYLFSFSPYCGEKQHIEGALLVFTETHFNKQTQKETESKLQEYKNIQVLCKTLMTNLPKAFVMTFDKELRFTYGGGCALEENGYNLDEMIGKPVLDILSKYNGEALIYLYEEALQGKENNIIRKTTTSGRHFSTTFAPIQSNEGEVLGGICIGFDIEDRKIIEQELEARVSELSLLNDRLGQEIKIKRFIETNIKHQSAELKRKNQELEQFAYVASHDLQEPLRMVSSFTQLLSKRYKGKMDSTADEFINFAVEGAQRMQILINDLLTYSRIGTRAKPFKNVDVKQVMRNAIDNLAMQVNETLAEIKTQGIADEIRGDDVQLTQLFQNLISNALKFKTQDSAPHVQITMKEKPEHYLFSVEDNGIGMDMAHEERIFQIFQRLHTRDKYPGTGIGLAICKKIVERHEGEIWVESEQGKGRGQG